LSTETPRVIQDQLGPGERVLWSGRPAQGLVFRQVDVLMIPFSLLWGGFAFFWEYSVISAGNAPFFFMLWGIPFVAIGLYVIGGRFFVDAKQRANTSYGVTNQRVIIVSGILSTKIKSLSLRTLSDLSLDQKAGGRGSVTFGPSNFPSWLSGGAAWPGMSSTAPMFELIEDSRSVFEIIRKAQGSAT
jgi:hypothetical protein